LECSFDRDVLLIFENVTIGINEWSENCQWYKPTDLNCAEHWLLVTMIPSETVAIHPLRSHIYAHSSDVGIANGRKLTHHSKKMTGSDAKTFVL
jgi:hypothetical protein